MRGPALRGSRDSAIPADVTPRRGVIGNIMEYFVCEYSPCIVGRSTCEGAAQAKTAIIIKNVSSVIRTMKGWISRGVTLLTKGQRSNWWRESPNRCCSDQLNRTENEAEHYKPEIPDVNGKHRKDQFTKFSSHFKKN